MDSARFGKALGIGARAAAKAVVSAADAATAEPPARLVTPSTNRAAGARLAAAQAISTGRGVREGTRRFGRAVWAPAARLSGILWLEVTGVFFGLFAATGATYCWHQRAVLHGGAVSGRQGFWVMAAMTLVFSYFCLSSFIQARRRGRQE